jgi:hypothetical protein
LLTQSIGKLLVIYQKNFKKSKRFDKNLFKLLFLKNYLHKTVIYDIIFISTFKLLSFLLLHMFKALKIVKNLNFFALLGVVVFVAIAVLTNLGSLTEITAYAQTAGPTRVQGPSLPTDVFGNPIVTDQGQLIQTIVNIAQTIIFIFAAACVLIIIWGGIQWGISGTEDGSKKGQQIIQNGVIGLIIAALSFLIIRIIFGIIQFLLDLFGSGNN